MKKQNKKAFSLLLAIFIVFICTLLALYLLDYIIPFMKNTKGMENGIKAYYQAYGGIEIALLERKNAGNDPYFETGASNTGLAGYSFSMISTGSSIPLAGEGNSDTDNNYNKISIKEPVQLLLKGNIKWSDVKFCFKIPNFTGGLSFSGGKEYNVINWQLSSDTDTLIAISTGSNIIKGNEIEESLFTGDPKLTINDRNGYKLSDEATRAGGTARKEESFSDFYTNNCINSGCTLKLSIVNNLETNKGNPIPYLDYKIIGFNPYVANYYTVIKSSGRVYGYRRDLKIFVPQKTTVSAFDFTIFQ